MEEGRHDNYLKAMGIEIWTQRVDLPMGEAHGVHPNVHPSVPPGMDPGADMAKVDPVEEQVAADQVEKVTLDDFRASDASVPEDEPEKPAKAEQPRISFTLGIVDALPNCCILVEMSAGSVELDRGPRQLVSDILTALGGDPARMSVGVQKWPMIDNPGVPQGEVEAQQVVAARLKKLIGDGPAPVLMLGDIPDRILTQADRDRMPGCTFVRTHELSDLLEHPMLKRELWYHLQPLISRR